MGRRIVGTALVVSLLVFPVAVAAADGARSREVFRFSDPAISESSGLVDLGGLMATANDSGNQPAVYAVDATGRTVGVTVLDVAASDIEALAPAGASAVWVGDIGDNARARPYVSVYSVPVAARSASVRPRPVNLVYPDGPQDAESLVSDASGRLYVITKAFTGGGVYRAPARLDPRFGNRLEKIGSVPDFATDAALLDEGRLLVRSYGLATVYSFPGLRRLGSFSLPPQPQGEGVSVGAGGRIRLSSEGRGTPVLEVEVPAALRRATAAGSAPARPREVRTSQGRSETSAWWLWPAGVILVGAAGIGIGLRRSRS